MLRADVKSGMLSCAFAGAATGARAGDGGSDDEDEDSNDEDEDEDEEAEVLGSLATAGKRGMRNRKHKGKGAAKGKAKRGTGIKLTMTRAQVANAHRPHLAAFTQRLCYKLGVSALAPPAGNPAFRAAPPSSAKAAASLAAALVVCPGGGVLAPTATTDAAAFALASSESVAARARSGWRSTVALHGRRNAMNALATEAVTRLMKQVQQDGAAKCVVPHSEAGEDRLEHCGTMSLAPAARVLLSAFFGSGSGTGGAVDEAKADAIGSAVGLAAASIGIGAAHSSGTSTDDQSAMNAREALLALVRAVGADAPSERALSVLSMAAG